MTGIYAKGKHAGALATTRGSWSGSPASLGLAAYRGLYEER